MGMRYVMRISGISLKNDSRGLYGSHQTITTVSTFESKHVPWLSLATQGGGDSVGATKDDRSSRGKKTTKRVSVCAEAIIARHGWTISGWRRQCETRGEKSQRPTRRRCQLCDRAHTATLLDLWRELLSRARNFYARGIERVREIGYERMDVSSSRLFANFGNIRSSSPSASRFPVFSFPSPSLLPIATMNRLSHP